MPVLLKSFTDESGFCLALRCVSLKLILLNILYWLLMASQIYYVVLQICKAVSGNG